MISETILCDVRILGRLQDKKKSINEDNKDREKTFKIFVLLSFIRFAIGLKNYCDCANSKIFISYTSRGVSTNKSAFSNR